MADTTPDTPPKKLLGPTLFVIVGIILALVFISWLLTRGAADDSSNVPTVDSSTTEQQLGNQVEPTNPNVTGGSSGAGTGNSNDPSTSTSPAGGVDTNQIPAGGTSPAQ